MHALNKEFASTHAFPGDVAAPQMNTHPARILQFGEGNFLRGFVDWMVDRMNRQGLFQGRVKVVQPIERGLIDLLNDQDGLYTLYLRGLEKGEPREQKEVIASIASGINPYADFEAFLAEAENPELRFVVSNTTEAGISYNADDSADHSPPSSFPAKVLLLLKRRYETFGADAGKGLVFLPCELIDRNGDNLKRIVLRLAEEWGLAVEFQSWIEGENIFCNTLVDRIVTGYPFDKIDEYMAELGYADKLVDTGELFHLWVIEGPKELQKELPLSEVGLNVVWTEDMTPYRTRKVRILNGAHTMTVMAAYLAGLDTVRECLDDATISAYLRQGIFEEIMPTMDMEREELASFAEAVLERFANPFIKHYLLSISLNSVSKYKARVLPTLKDYIERTGRVPRVLSFALAALISFYRGTGIHNGALIGTRNGETYKIVDNPEVLDFFYSAWGRYDGSDEAADELVRTVLAKEEFWGEDLTQLTGLSEAVLAHLSAVRTQGMAGAIADLCGQEVAR